MREVSWYRVVAVVALVLSISQQAKSEELASLASVQWFDLDTFSLDGPQDTGMNSASAAVADNGFGFGGSATANAAYGTIGVAASGTATSATSLLNVAQGFAAFTDGLTITGEPVGTPGEITFTFDITGTSSMTGDGGVTVDLYVIQGPLDFLSLGSATFEISPSDFSFTTDPFPINYGEEFDLTVILGVTALVFNNGTAEGSYANTITLTDVGVKVDGAAVTEFAIQSESNFEYPGGASDPSSTVPEPSSALLAVFGLLSLAMRRRRRR